MKITIAKNAVAMAVTTLLASGAVLAQDAGVQHLSISDNISITGDFPSRHYFPGSASFATVDDTQSASNGLANNNDLHNFTSTGNDVMTGAKGNIGLNMAAGDNNLQDNAAAISVSAPSLSGALVDAEVFVQQSANGNATFNSAVDNSANIGVNAFKDAAGNIGVNVAAGNNNLQKNNTAISVGDGVLAVASVTTDQSVCGNFSDYAAGTGNANTVLLNSSAFMNASGNIGVNMASGNNNLQSNSMALSVTYPVPQ